VAGHPPLTPRVVVAPLSSRRSRSRRRRRAALVAVVVAPLSWIRFRGYEMQDVTLLK